MNEEKIKYKFRNWEIISLVILTPVIYLAITILLREPIDSHIGNWFRSPLSFFAIIAFNFIWILIMKICPLRNTKIKVIATLIIFILSASILTWWVIFCVFLPDNW